MRRRSERKKSTDVSSPAPARRAGRRRKSTSLSEDAEGTNELKNDQQTEEDNFSSKENDQDSSEERLTDGKRRRSSRRTPVREQRSSPSKRRTKQESAADGRIDSIPEEENGKDDKTNDSDVEPAEETAKETKQENAELINSKEQEEPSPKETSPEQNNADDDTKIVQNENHDEEQVEDKNENSTRLCAKSDLVEEDKKVETLQIADQTSKMSAKSESGEEPDKDEVKLHTRDNSSRSRSNSSESNQTPKEQKPTQAEEDAKVEEPEDGEVIEKDANNSQANEAKKKTVSDDSPKGKDKQELEVKETQDDKPNETSNTTAAADTGRPSISATATTTRKRRWITKKGNESKEAVLAISTDSLKTLIADVQPVPLSDVQLESSSDVEEVVSEREEGEQSPSPEPEIRRRKDSNPDALLSTKLNSFKENNIAKISVSGVLGAVPAPIHRSPSPARNQASSVLYITNLVRPFTVLQLKGLLARTGKIVEDGFWIDRIKSKCYVEYQNEE